jgi:hypothetical protein
MGIGDAPMDFAEAPMAFGEPPTSFGKAPMAFGEPRIGFLATRMEVLRQPSRMEAGSGGNGAVRSPAFEEVSSMLRRILVLALLLGILPAAVRALPRSSEPAAPAAVHSAQDWLLRLGSLLDGLWKRATENTGKTIDPDGQPQSLPGDGDTGKSIDPNG